MGSWLLHWGLPVYGCNPDLLFWGTKSGRREIFKECGVDIPAGYENLQNEAQVIKALADLYENNPLTRKAVIKMNDGFSGEGNAIFCYDKIENGDSVEVQIQQLLPEELEIVASDLSYHQYITKFTSMGGIVEVFINAPHKASPSVWSSPNDDDLVSIRDSNRLAPSWRQPHGTPVFG